jgi:hypothetical protein
MSEHLDTARAAEAQRRRSHRLLLPVSLRVSSVPGAAEAFEESVVTLVVNAHGGLITLAAPVQMGQVLRIVHQQTSEEIESTVVFLGSTQDGKTQVAFEFRRPSPKFWRIAFPPDDWHSPT